MRQLEQGVRQNVQPQLAQIQRAGLARGLVGDALLVTVLKVGNRKEVYR